MQHILAGTLLAACLLLTTIGGTARNRGTILSLMRTNWEMFVTEMEVDDATAMAFSQVFHVDHLRGAAIESGARSQKKEDGKRKKAMISRSGIPSVASARLKLFMLICTIIPFFPLFNCLRISLLDND